MGDAEAGGHVGTAQTFQPQGEGGREKLYTIVLLLESGSVVGPQIFHKLLDVGSLGCEKESESIRGEGR